MAIAPIDLQVMYLQMDNVAQIASKQNIALLGDAKQQQKQVLEDIHKAEVVNKAAREEALVSSIDKDGRGQGGYGGGSRSKRGLKEGKEHSGYKGAPPSPDIILKKAWLGQHIDIKG